MTLALTSPKLSRTPSALLAIALLLLAGCGEDGGTTTVEPPKPEFRLVSLEPLAASTAFPLGPRLAITDAGQIAGSVVLADGTTQPAVWQAGAVTSMGIAGAALDISGDGTVVGSSEGDAFVWRDGEVLRVTEQEPFSTQDSFAAGINDAGTFAGSLLTCSRGCAGSAFVAQGTDPADLGTAGAPASVARDINAKRVVVGELDRDLGANQQAFSWLDGVFTFLTPQGVFSRANAINGSGEIVGMAAVAGGVHAVLWRGSSPVDLGTLPELYVSEALGINDAGQILRNQLPTRRSECEPGLSLPRRPPRGPQRPRRAERLDHRTCHRHQRPEADRRGSEEHHVRSQSRVPARPHPLK